jgi:hypothetical protein
MMNVEYADQKKIVVAVVILFYEEKKRWSGQIIIINASHLL